ncbi:universal stress protein [Robiginitalea aurantiaca]|uniref:Universal stress protein n=1 Tax=Robiginitalea aurantiaca TaxID=3056915 RepID=A0ABT7WBQ3_9FLAO|nr:universal stress protein [Robiginitalea aurantiaca]MDM9630338.1 universal stress protein [Robiginitalea aurantiaca]
MHHILIPTDFSGTALNAVNYALSFYKGERCAFHFLNTYTPDFVHSRVMALAHGGNQAEDAMQMASEEGLRNLIESLSAQEMYSHHEFHSVSSFNLLSEEVKEQVAHYPIDMIVSGTTGASGIKEVFLGSNTVRILRAASDRPVLVIPRAARFRDAIKIGLVTDFGVPYSSDQIEAILEFQNKLDAQLEVMHIGSPASLTGFQELHKHQLFLELERAAPRMRWCKHQSSKAQAIEDYLESSSVEMLIMIRNDHHLVDEWLREPVVKRVAFHTNVPMLVLPPVQP